MPDRDLFALYVHWPFCLSKCPYCDFNSHVVTAVDHHCWRRNLLRALEHAAQDAPPRPLTSIFFGGGTPSLMEPETVGALIERAAALFAVSDDIEITLEANPATVDVSSFHGFRAAGVNRLSLGGQSLREHSLRFLGRCHSVTDVRAALDLGRRVFPRLSLDLIYALPGQTPPQWRAELSEALAWADVEHMSLYQLTIERGTRFFTDHARGDFTVPAEQTALDLWTVTQEVTQAAGLPLYEVSNHARPGCECRHNLAYWTGAEYVGIGPGAHGRVTRDGQPWATREHRSPQVWSQMIDSDDHRVGRITPLPPYDRALEMLMMGLRLRKGLRLADFEQRAAVAADQIIDFGMVETLAQDGLVRHADGRLMATSRGMTVLDGIIAAVVRSAPCDAAAPGCL